MDFHPVDVIISLINITVLFILLRLILFKHVIRFMRERAERVRGEMDDANKRQLDAEALRSEYNEKIGNIEEKGRELLRESQQRANAESERILKETKDKAGAMLRDAEARIAEKKEQALVDAHAEVTQLATDMAVRILGREVSPDDNINVVDEFFRPM